MILKSCYSGHWITLCGIHTLGTERNEALDVTESTITSDSEKMADSKSGYNIACQKKVATHTV
eukprot:scaffold421259_cov45-Attheya_sp.AAC.3